MKKGMIGEVISATPTCPVKHENLPDGVQCPTNLYKSERHHVKIAKMVIVFPMRNNAETPSNSWGPKRLHDYLMDRHSAGNVISIEHLERIYSQGLRYDSHDMLAVRFALSPPDGIFLERYHIKSAYHLDIHYAAREGGIETYYNMDPCVNFFKSQKLKCNNLTNLKTDDMRLEKALRIYQVFYDCRNNFRLQPQQNRSESLRIVS